MGKEKSYNEIDPTKGLFACNIIVTKSGLPKQNYLVIGKTSKEVGKKAEALFQRKIEEHAEKRSLTEDEIEVAKEDGYFSIPNTEYEVFLTWPSVEDGRK